MKKVIRVLFVIALTFAFLNGCSKDEETVEINDIIISGTLQQAVTGRSISRAVQYDLYRLYCATFTEQLIAGSGDADSNGAFTLALSEAKGLTFACFVLNKKTGNVVAPLQFQESDKTGLDGGIQTQGQISLTGSSSMGNIILDLDTGTASVDINNITTLENISNTVVSEFWDFTGTWEMTNVQGTLPDGYDLMPECGGGVHGPCIDATTGEGMEIYLKRVSGKDIAANNTVYGMMVWQSEIAYNTCGKKLGFSNADSKTYGKVDFTDSINSGLINEGVFDWTPNAGCGTFLDGTGWKCSLAQAQRDILADGSSYISAFTNCTAYAPSTDAEQKAVLQCFAQAYLGLIDSTDPLVCAQHIHFDWSATTADNFVLDDGPVKAKLQYEFEKFIYSTTTSGSFSKVSEWVDSVYDEVNDVNHHCKMVEQMSMNIVRVSDSEALGDIQIDTRLIADQSASACASAVQITSKVSSIRYRLRLIKQ